MEIKDIISSGLLELYVLGLASAEESKQVETWMALYPEVRSEIDEIQAGMEVYAEANSIKPDADVKARIMSRINSENKLQSVPLPDKQQAGLNGKESAARYTLSSYFKWAAAACFILLLGSLVLNYTFYNRYRNANSELEIAKNELSRQEKMATDMGEQITVMTDKNSFPVSLKGTAHAPDASAKIFWMKNTGEVYVAPGALPQAPAGKQYQLWAIVDGKPVDAGMISNDRGDVYHIQKMKSFGKAQAFAITLEKAGGSPSPTMEEMYVMAEI